MGQAGQRVLTSTGKVWRFGARRKNWSLVAATIPLRFFEVYKRGL